jgi:hypothetical protein
MSIFRIKEKCSIKGLRVRAESEKMADNEIFLSKFESSSSSLCYSSHMAYSSVLNVAAAGSRDSVYFVPHCTDSTICVVAASNVTLSH